MASVGALLGPRKGVFLTPDTGPFFPSDTDIQPKINVARHRHSELVTRHLTLDFSPTPTVSYPIRRRTLRKISGRRQTLRPLFMGPITLASLSLGYYPPFSIKDAHKRKCSEDKLSTFRSIIIIRVPHACSADSGFKFQNSI